MFYKPEHPHMIYATDYYFTDGKQRVELATFVFNGSTISFEIKYSGEAIDSPHFNPCDLAEQLRQIIHFPLLRAGLRARTMPSTFKPLAPNSMEHFSDIRHNTTYYKFSPVRRL